MEATTTHRVGTTAIAVFLVAFVACAIPAATATGAVPMDTRAKPCGCSWTVDQLPRTPDAVEGWYARC